MGEPLGTCRPCRLAGRVAASLAITTSPGRKKSTNPERRAWIISPLRPDHQELRPWTAAGWVLPRRSWDASWNGTAVGAARRQSHRDLSGRSCGRFRAALSASGTAAACNGVSMSPGSIETIVLQTAQARRPRSRSNAAARPCSRRTPPSSRRRLSPRRWRRSKPPRQRPRGPTRQGAQNRFRQAERPEHVGGECPFQVSQSVSPSNASGVGPRSDALFIKMSSPPSSPTICSAIGWMSPFTETSPTIPCVPAQFTRHLLDPAPRAGDEGHPGAALEQFPHEGKAQPGRAAVTATRKPAKAIG